MMSLYRFQCTLYPFEQSLDLQAYWVPYSPSSGENQGFIGFPVQGVNRSYPSIADANHMATQNPEWAAIAEKFPTEPFTAISELLEAIKQFDPPPPNDLP
jgi:hypothetical protein